MKIVDQLCTLEQAKKFHALGLFIETYFLYNSHGHPIEAWMVEGNEDQFYRAFTSSELGVMIPNIQAVIGWEVWYNDHIGEWNCTIRDFIKWKGGETPPPVAYESEGETMAEAMAEALLHCLNNNLVTVDDLINKMIDHD